MKYKKITKRITAWGLALALVVTGSGASSVSAAKKITRKNITLKVGKTKTLKFKNASKKVKWSTSNKKVVKIKKKKGKKKNTAVIKAVKKGTAKITAKSGSRKMIVKVKVKGKGASDGDGANTSSPSGSPGATLRPSASPSVTRTPAPTGTGSGGNSPSPSSGAGQTSNPGTGDPSNPGTGDPSNPGTGDPSNPGTGDPSDPWIGDPNAAHTLKISVKKDGKVWKDCDKSLTLYDSDGEYIAEFGGTNELKVKNGIYTLYEGDKETNMTIIVNGGDQTYDVNYYTVRFLNAEDNQEIATQVGYKGQVIREPSAMRTGHYALWYSDKKCTFPIDFNDEDAPITFSDNAQNSTFYGEIWLYDYYIAYSLDGGEFYNIDPNVVKKDKTNEFEGADYFQNFTIESGSITLPTPTKWGYTFTGWTGSNGYMPEMEVTIEISEGNLSDKRYTANWIPNAPSYVGPWIYPDKDIFSVGKNGDQKKGALVMPVNQMVNDQYLGNAMRVGETPQGYESYIYNDGIYEDYFVVYLYNGRIAGMATMSKNFSYQYGVDATQTVSYGDVVPMGFSSLPSSYGYSGAYYKETDSAYIIVHKNAATTTSNRGKIYALQVFAKSVLEEDGTSTSKELKDLIDGQTLSRNGAYSDAVTESMAKELMDWVNAYRRSDSGKEQFGVWTYEGNNTAQTACNIKAGKEPDLPGSGLIDKYSYAYGDLDPTWMREIDGSNSPDAFGFMTWWLDERYDKHDALYEALVKSPQINEYYACAGFAFDGGQSPYAVLHFVHP